MTSENGRVIIAWQSWRRYEWERCETVGRYWKACRDDWPPLPTKAVIVKRVMSAGQDMRHGTVDPVVLGNMARREEGHPSPSSAPKGNEANESFSVLTRAGDVGDRADRIRDGLDSADWTMTAHETSNARFGGIPLHCRFSDGLLELVECFRVFPQSQQYPRPVTLAVRSSECRLRNVTDFDSLVPSG